MSTTTQAGSPTVVRRGRLARRCSTGALVLLVGCASGQATSAQEPEARPGLVAGSPALGAGKARGGAPAPTPPASDVQISALRERALELLMGAAQDDSPLLRANALEALHPAPLRAEPLARLGLQDHNVGVRFVAAMTIGELRLADSAPLVKPLLRDESPVVRAAAIYALSRNNIPTDPTALAAMLRMDDPRVRAQAVFVLGEMGNPSAIPMLRAAAADPMPRASLVEVQILRLQVAEALAKLGEDDAVETLRAALFPARPEELEITALAVQIIGEVGDRRSLGQLIYLMEQKGDDLLPAEVRLAAAGAAAKMGEPGGAFIAAEYMGNESPAIRAQAAFVYGEIGKPENLPRLEALLADPDPIVRVSAGAAVLRVAEQSSGDRAGTRREAAPGAPGRR